LIAALLTTFLVPLANVLIPCDLLEEIKALTCTDRTAFYAGKVAFYSIIISNDIIKVGNKKLGK
jgi:hypothetical protein